MEGGTARREALPGREEGTVLRGGEGGTAPLRWQGGAAKRVTGSSRSSHLPHTTTKRSCGLHCHDRLHTQIQAQLMSGRVTGSMLSQASLQTATHTYDSANPALVATILFLHVSPCAYEHPNLCDS